MLEKMLEKIYSYFEVSNGVSTDTRKITPKQLFFCLKGPNFNANSLAIDALEKGALKVICDEQMPEHLPYSNKIIYVENTLKTLQNLANHHRKQNNYKVIALTGSNGKTTTKELLKEVLCMNYKVFVTPGNFNNHIGLPLSLLQTNKSHEIVVLEMGDSKLGDIEELCNIAEPDMGFITNIGKDHIGEFGSFENNVLSKLELFNYLNEHNCQFFIDSKNNELYQYLPKDHNHFLPNFNLTVLSNDAGFLQLKYESNLFDTAITGSYNGQNIIYSLIIADYFGIEITKALSAITKYVPGNNRSQILKTTDNTLLLDAYNANPSSVTLALESFFNIKNGLPKAIILGDMLELGESSEEEHLHILNLLSSQRLIQIFLIGEIYKKFQQDFPFHFFKSRDEFKRYLNENPLSNHFILLKGSRKFQLEKLAEVL